MLTMKNVIVKTIVFIGFLVVLLGLIIDPLIVQASTPAEEAAVSAPLVITALFIAFPFFFVYLILSVIFGMVFIFSKNETLANVGYALGAFAGAFGVMILIDSKTFSLILIPIGLICMMVGAALKGILVIIGFFGFVKPDGKQAIVNVADALSKYKELEKDGVLSEEEFLSLKDRALGECKPKNAPIDDLKKWKKLLDQNVITEEEFAALKAKVFAE